jgi:pyruvate dehydrogenase E2 component (dihydrolipoamide acetyltransferase)
VETPLTNMRKTIAARLTESKTTIPHYYIKVSVEMDKINAVRNELNTNEK